MAIEWKVSPDAYEHYLNTFLCLDGTVGSWGTCWCRTCYYLRNN